MKGYILSIAAAAVISAVMTMITPEKWSKYVGIITGLLVVVCIGQPLLKLVHSDMFEEIAYDTETHEDYGNEQLVNEIKGELCKRVEEDAKARLMKEFHADCEVKAEVSVNHNGQIEGINSLTIYGGNIDAAAIGRLREVYGAEEVRYGGDQKNLSEPE